MVALDVEEPDAVVDVHGLELGGAGGQLKKGLVHPAIQAAGVELIVPLERLGDDVAAGQASHIAVPSSEYVDAGVVEADDVE